MGKKTKDIDAFNSKTSTNGFVNDAVSVPLNILKFLRRDSKRDKMLEEVKKEAGGY